MAHYHPNLDEPCAHDTEARWQDNLQPHPLVWPSWLVVLCEAAFLLCLGALVWVGVFAVQP